MSSRVYGETDIKYRHVFWSCDHYSNTPSQYAVVPSIRKPHLLEQFPLSQNS